jgi:hypothetical protein
VARIGLESEAVPEEIEPEKNFQPVNGNTFIHAKSVTG